MKILLAVDGSPCSDLAIAEAPVEPSLLRGSPPTVFDEIVKQNRVEICKRLTERGCQYDPVPRLKPTSFAETARRSPKDAAIDEAARWGANPIVVGSHGHGPIRRFFLGSVSLFVARHAPYSVLVVRQPPEISPPGNTPATAESS